MLGTLSPRPTPIQRGPTLNTTPTHQPLTATRSEGDLVTANAPCLTTGRSSTLHNRLLVAKEHNALLPSSTKGPPRTPLDKYTKGIMPKVHTASTTSTLDLIDINLVLEWENYEHGKLLALPFGNKADNADNHSHIGERLLMASSEITESENLSISIQIPRYVASRIAHTHTY